MTENKKHTYVVVAGSVGNVDVGGEIELTEAQAKAMLNKVVPKSEYGKSPQAASADLEKAQSEADRLKASNVSLTEQLAEMAEKVESLTQERDSLQESVNSLLEGTGSDTTDTGEGA